MSEADRERLVYLKELFVMAERRAKDESWMGRFLAVIELFLPVEGLLAVLSQKRPRKKGEADKYKTFRQLWEDAERGYRHCTGDSKCELPSQNEIIRLRDHRNNAVHKQYAPGPEEVTWGLVTARTFLNEVITAAFDTALEQLSREQLVTSERWKCHLNNASRAATQGLWEDCAGELSCALRLALLEIRKADASEEFPLLEFYDVTSEEWYKQAMDACGMQSDFPDFLISVKAAVRSLADEIQLASLGLDLRAYRRLQPIILPVRIEHNGKAEYTRDPWPERTEQDCADLKDFVLDLLLSVERRAASHGP